MNETQQKLYTEMQKAYEAWANMSRPHAKNWSPLALVATPGYFEKLGNFRKPEWEMYCAARDAYLESLGHSNLKVRHA